MNEEVEELLEKVRKWILEEGGVVCPHKYGMCKHDNENCPVFCIDQALAILRTAPEQPNCEGCEFFKHTDKLHHCWRYTQETSLCKLRQEPIEQPPAGEFTKKVRKDWDKNIFGGVIYDLCAIIDRSEASRKELKELLTEYGRHSPGCSAEFDKKYHCRCGWSETNAAIAKEGGKNE